MTDDRQIYRTARAPRVLGLGAILLLAFAAGIALTAFAVRRWDRVATWLHPVAAASPVVAPVALIAPQPAPPPMASAPDPALAGRIDGLDRRIDAIDARATAASGDADRAEGLAVAVAARRALDRGQPLGFIEGLLRTHFGGTEPQAVAMVIGAAQRPVTLIQLQEGYDALAPALAPAAGGGWWSGFRRELGSIFVIRRAATPSDLPGARQARAVRALAQGQVDVALDEVARAPRSPQTASWIDMARRYVLARNALDRIETAALLKPAARSGAAGE